MEMHPIEHLRYVARARGADPVSLVRETISAFGGLRLRDLRTPCQPEFQALCPSSFRMNLGSIDNFGVVVLLSVQTCLKSYIALRRNSSVVGGHSAVSGSDAY